MHVTHLWVNKWSSGKMVGYATFRFALTPGGAGSLTIKNFKVFRTDDGGYRVGMPDEKLPDGSYKPTVDFYQKDNDAKALLDEMNQWVTAEFNKGTQQSTRQQAKQSNNMNMGTNNTTNSGIPF